jgi:hypothetical protein
MCFPRLGKVWSGNRSSRAMNVHVQMHDNESIASSAMDGESAIQS